MANIIESKLLVEKWKPIVESTKARKVKSPEVMSRLLENTEHQITEAATTLGDISQYTPIIVPAVRRIVPNLLANEIVGVQAMNGPTGYAFAFRFAYDGAGTKKDFNVNHSYPTATRGVQKNSQAFKGFAMILNATAPTGTAVGTPVKVSSTEIGRVAHVEGNKVLIDLFYKSDGTTLGVHHFNNITNGIGYIYPDATPTVVYADPTAGTICLGATGTDAVVATITFNNEAGYNLIFSNYIPSYATGSAEYLARTDMKTMKMKVERFAIEAQTRKLKAEYSIELAQDLKAVHGMDAEAEIINMLEYEITAELDRELVQAIYDNCTSAGRWNYGTAGIYNGGQGVSTGLPASGFYGVADGRNEMEKFRTLYTRIVREANAVAIATRRGAANFIICSLNVATALETMQNFMYSAVPGNVETTIGVAKIGTLDGRFTVYLDTFAYDDFFVVGFKGNHAWDSGIIYCPYVPLMIQRVTDPTTFQPLVGMQIRDAIVGNMWGTEKYYRKVSCNFAGSSLLSGNYYI